VQSGGLSTMSIKVHLGSSLCCVKMCTSASLCLVNFGCSARRGSVLNLYAHSGLSQTCHYGRCCVCVCVMLQEYCFMHSALQ